MVWPMQSGAEGDNRSLELAVGSFGRRAVRTDRHESGDRGESRKERLILRDPVRDLVESFHPALTPGDALWLVPVVAEE